MLKRSDLAGNNIQNIVTGLDFVPDMVTDPEQSKIYWIDNNRNSIESADYDGKNRKLVFRTLNTGVLMGSIAVYKVK